MIWDARHQLLNVSLPYRNICTTPLDSSVWCVSTFFVFSGTVEIILEMVEKSTHTAIELATRIVSKFSAGLTLDEEESMLFAQTLGQGDKLSCFTAFFSSMSPSHYLEVRSGFLHTAGEHLGCNTAADFVREQALEWLLIKHTAAPTGADIMKQCNFGLPLQMLISASHDAVNMKRGGSATQRLEYDLVAVRIVLLHIFVETVWRVWRSWALTLIKSIAAARPNPRRRPMSAHFSRVSSSSSGFHGMLDSPRVAISHVQESQCHLSTTILPCGGLEDNGGREGVSRDDDEGVYSEATSAAGDFDEMKCKLLMWRNENLRHRPLNGGCVELGAGEAGGTPRARGAQHLAQKHQVRLLLKGDRARKHVIEQIVARGFGDAADFYVFCDRRDKHFVGQSELERALNDLGIVGVDARSILELSPKVHSRNGMDSAALKVQSRNYTADELQLADLDFIRVLRYSVYLLY